MRHNDDSFEPRLDAEFAESLQAEFELPSGVDDRLVTELRSRGVLATQQSVVRVGNIVAGAPIKRGPQVRRVAFALAAAACITTAFMAGFRAGEKRVQSGLPTLTAARTTTQHSGAVDVSQELSRAALQYLEVLSRVNPADSTTAKVALLTLRAAGDEIVRIAPESEVAQAMKVVSLGFFRTDPAIATAVATPTRLIWF